MIKEIENRYINDVWDGLNKHVLKFNCESFDVCDNTSTKLYIKLINLSKNTKHGKYLYYPFFLSNQYFPSVIRKFSGVRKKQFPQAFAVLTRGYVNAYKKTKNDEYLSLAGDYLKELLKLKSEGYKHNCWGQPYNWYSRKFIPKNTPRSTVTSQALAAMLDYYEVTKDESWLNEAIDVGLFFVNEMKPYSDEDGDICFPYTTIDNYKVHNPNVLVSAALARLYHISNKESFNKISEKSLRFTLKHQNPDGSWYYWAPPDKLLHKIDNYHTGFVLESLLEFKKISNNGFIYESELKNGLDFYTKNLFTSDMIPKMTDKKLYPIDIQSCAQSIITLMEAQPYYNQYDELIQKIIEWTLSNLYSRKYGYFYYRVYKNGFVDKSNYIRWSQSWMQRALSYLIK